MKPYDLVKENIQFLLDQTQKQVDRKIKRDMLSLYWKIGFELRDFQENELSGMIRKLSKDLQLQKEMLILSWEFYSIYPFFKKAMRCAK